MQVIDVRSKQEYDQGHVDGAVWFDVERIASGEMPDAPKDEELVLYCRSGARSTTAMHVMQANGFTNVRSAGGLADMSRAGYRIVVS